MGLHATLRLLLFCMQGLSEGANPLQLRDVVALLRKSDDHSALLKGLAALGPLVEAAPHELDSYAGSLPSGRLHDEVAALWQLLTLTLSDMPD